MILEIEHYKYDTRLIGKIKDISQLKRQLKKIETLYDKENDNFNELFCRMFSTIKCNAIVHIFIWRNGKNVHVLPHEW